MEYSPSVTCPIIYSTTHITSIYIAHNIILCHTHTLPHILMIYTHTYMYKSRIWSFVCAMCHVVRRRHSLSMVYGREVYIVSFYTHQHKCTKPTKEHQRSRISGMPTLFPAVFVCAF